MGRPKRPVDVFFSLFSHAGARGRRLVGGAVARDLFSSPARPRISHQSGEKQGTALQSNVSGALVNMSTAPFYSMTPAGKANILETFS